MAKCCQPAARGAVQEALLDEVGLDHVFDGVAGLADGGGQVVQPHRPAVEAVHQGLQQLAVHQVKAHGVHVQQGQSLSGGVAGDAAIAFDLGPVAHAAQQAVGDARRAAGAPGDFQRAFVVDGGAQQVGGAADDALQLVGRVELQAGRDAEAVPQRVGEHASAGGGAHQREGLQVELDRAGGWTFADQDVDLEVFQRGVQDLFDDRRQPMDFVDEQDVVALQAGQDGSQVPRLFQHWA